MEPVTALRLRFGSLFFELRREQLRGVREPARDRALALRRLLSRGGSAERPCLCGLGELDVVVEVCAPHEISHPAAEDAEEEDGGGAE